MKRALSLVALVILGLGAVAFARAWMAGAAAGEATPEPPAPLAFDPEAAVEHFAEALRIRTVSHGADSGVARDDEAFRAFHRLLERLYPRVHAALRRETVAEHALLYTWPGRDPSLAPVLLMGHFDVVPVDPEGLSEWTHPPFDGVVADGQLWGRGALDDKFNVVAQLEAVEALLAEGFEPERTFLFAFGHDEELGGPEGAAGIAALLAERGVRPLLVADEGGGVLEGALPGLRAPLAAIGIAEKGYVSVTLEVHTKGGHSSAPPADTAIGMLARAIERLEEDQMPSHFAGPIRQTLDAVAPHTGLGPRLVLCNLWLFGPLVERAMLSVPEAATMLRTTTAPTIFQAGVKDNVLPSVARAVVNFRIFPGDTIDGVLDHVVRVVGDERVTITPSEKRREASGVTSVDTPAFALLSDSIRQVYPDVVPAPYLITGGTDARHFRGISDGVFGFMPVRIGLDAVKRAHGNDERVRVDAYLDGIRFYAQLVRNASAWR